MSKPLPTALFLLLLSAALAPAVLSAQDSAAEGSGEPIDYSRSVVLFWGERCPHCHEAIDYLESLADSYPLLTFAMIEVAETDNQANRVYFHETMARLGSRASGYPRLVVGDRVFAGFSASDGPLQWMESHGAYAGFRNRIEEALDELRLEVARAGDRAAPGERASAPPIAADTELSIQRIGSRGAGEPPGRTGQAAVPAGQAAAPGLRSAVVAGLLVAYLLLALLVTRRRRGGKEEARLWAGGGVLLALVGLFVIVSGVPEGAVAEAARGLPFPLFVTAIALLDGFNPCAFTVLFILLSLLTHARRRRHMVAVGGIFVLASAAVYVAFIFAIIAVGSFALANLGTWVLRLIGAAVLIIGAVSIYRVFTPTAASGISSLSTAQKAGLSRRAGRVVRRFTEAETPGTRLTALGATVILAVVVNGVELGCTAILPAVYMSALVSTFGSGIAAPHIAWTLWYGLIYVLPMVAILVNFLVTFRSERLSATQGRRLKLAGSGVMVLLGGVLTAAPQLLRF